MHSDSILFRNYVDGIRVDARHAKAIAVQLANAAPPDLGDAGQRALAAVTARGQEVQDAVWVREQVTDERVGELRLELITIGGTVQAALSAISRIPAEISGRGARAASMLRVIFPDGTGLGTGDAPVIWAAADRRRKAVEEGNLREELGALIGDDMWIALERKADELAEAIGAGAIRRDAASSVSLRELNTRFSHAVAAYCRVLAAQFDEDDPASVERFRGAVAPIDEHRARSGQRAASGADAEEPMIEGDDPTPVVDPVPPDVNEPPIV